MAVLLSPTVFPLRACRPSAVLKLPAVLLNSEDQPCAVLSDPVVLGLSASTSSAALLPLPRSSEGGFAWATDASAIAASANAMTTKLDRKKGERIRVLISMLV